MKKKLLCRPVELPGPSLNGPGTFDKRARNLRQTGLEPSTNGPEVRR